jgi:hypothetical protein
MAAINLVKLLEGLKATNAYFEGDDIVVCIEGTILLRNRVKIVESEEWVGSWWKERTNNTIRLDNRMQQRQWFLSLAIHEVIERWLMYDSDWRLPYDRAHPISEKIEKGWHIKNLGSKSWNNYMEKVEQIWKNEN